MIERGEARQIQGWELGAATGSGLGGRARERAADPRLGRGPRRDRRGRREHRLDRCRRDPARRAAERGRGPGPRVLRPRRDRADRHRRQRRARPDRRGDHSPAAGCRWTPRRPRPRSRAWRRGSASRPLETAVAIVEVADSAMVQATRLMTVRRGLDPARLRPASRSAARARCTPAARRRSSGFRSVIVPPDAGVLSAFGLLA